MSDLHAGKFTDSDGRKCDLSTMCRREPEWAASRIDTLTNALATMTALRDEASSDAQRLHRVLDLLAEHGCDCDCACDSDGHDADCEPCFPCRVEEAAHV